MMREHTLHFEEDTIDMTVLLDVIDDDIAENEEVFIVHTNFTESAGDRCAVAVRLRDNDGRMLHDNRIRCN